MAGQPTKYKPEYCADLIAHMSEGYSFESFAGKVGVCRDTLYAWRDAHSEFSDTIKRAKDAALLFWERQGMNGMFAPKEFNSAIWIFSMKTRFGWKEVQGHEHSGVDGKPIETKALADIPDDELDAKIALMTAKIKGETNG